VGLLHDSVTSVCGAVSWPRHPLVVERAASVSSGRDADATWRRRTRRGQEPRAGETVRSTSATYRAARLGERRRPGPCRSCG